MSRNFIVLDTEAVSAVKHSGNNAHPETSLVYDFGFIVANREGEIVDRFSFINSDVFFQSDLMQSAYYAKKLPQYFEGMGQEWEVANTLTIYRTLANACKTYNVKDIWAYNVRYDMTALNNTVRTFSNGFRSFFAPHKTNYRDIWDYAGSTICNTAKFVKWCDANGFVTPTGNPSTSADTVAKYVSGDLTFNEHHTALSDCECELSILLAALKRKTKARHSKGQGWRDAAKKAKQIR